MNELATYQGNLPDTPSELAKFIAFSQERAKALEAEIRAIKRLELAEEVYKLKQAELNQLRCQMLLAYDQMGCFTRNLPTKQGDRTDVEHMDASDHKFQKSKKDALKDIGVTQRQASRYEKIAAHPDVVEKVISEAEAGQTEPTQAEVLRRIREKESGGNVTSFADARKKRYDNDMQKIDDKYKKHKLFNKAVNLSAILDITDDVLDILARDEDSGAAYYIDLLSEAIQALTDIRTRLIVKGSKYGKTNRHTGN